MAKTPPSGWWRTALGGCATCPKFHHCTHANRPRVRLLPSICSYASSTMRGALVLLAAVLAYWLGVLPWWPAVLGQYAAPQQSLSGTLPSKAFTVRAAPFLPGSRGHLSSAADELGQTSATSECTCLHHCLMNDHCFQLQLRPRGDQLPFGPSTWPTRHHRVWPWDVPRAAWTGAARRLLLVGRRVQTGDAGSAMSG